MPMPRHPEPRRPRRASAVACRTLSDHHEQVERIAAAATKAFRRGVREYRVPLTGGDVLVLIPKIRGEATGAMPILLYWTAYWEIDGVLREVRPFREEP